MRRSEDFARAIRGGARAGRTTLVVHSRMTTRDSGVRFGFVVSKAVGGAVVRNRVRRRLRGLVMEHIDTVPQGADVVVRALPPAASVDYVTLGSDLRSALSASMRRAEGRGRPEGTS